MSTAPAFLFDLDGTLADTLGDIAASTNHVRARYDLPPVGHDLIRAFVGDGARTLLARALDDVVRTGPNPQATLDRAFRTYAEHHTRQCTTTVELYPGVREYLEQLRAAGHRMAVVTNKPSRFATPIVRHLGLDKLLPVVVGGDTLPQRKPDPAPLRFALAELGCEAGGATMVGDGVQDVRAGKAVGMRTVACLFGFGDPERLRSERADVYWRAFGIEEPT